MMSFLSPGGPASGVRSPCLPTVLSIRGFAYAAGPAAARRCLRFLVQVCFYFRRGDCKQERMSAALQLELQALHTCVDETDADRAREIVGNVAQICLSDITQRNIGCNRDA